jgi:peptide deformylase
MILPIFAYGEPVLRKKSIDIDRNYVGLEALIQNMFDTLQHAEGVGLAAPQVGRAIRLFVVDTREMKVPKEKEATHGKEEDLKDFKKVFINAQIVAEEGEEWNFEEGCLSIPGVREDVLRKPRITIEYLDENFNKHRETYDGLRARVIQHEYDHIEGVLFTDKMSSLKKQLLRGKLTRISKGFSEADYPMHFHGKTRAVVKAR